MLLVDAILLSMMSLQFEYDDWVAEQCGCPGIEDWRKQMFNASSKKRFDRPETYRDDEWEDHDLILQANEDFIMYTSNRAVT